MPIVSGGGGGGGNTTAQVVASGRVVPVGTVVGVTVDTTTYADPVRGGGAKLATLVFATEGAGFAIAQAGDAFPRWLLTSDGTDGLYIGDGTYNPYSSSAANLFVGAAHGGLAISAAAAGNSAAQLQQVSPKTTIVSGALPTVQLVSGAGSVIHASRDVEAHTAVTYNPGVATTATCTVTLSPDNVTYSTLCAIAKPVGTVFDGSVDDVVVRVPAGWWLALTVVNATLGLTTYY